MPTKIKKTAEEKPIIQSQLNPIAAPGIPVKPKMTPKSYITMVFFTICFNVCLWILYRAINDETATIIILLVMVIFTLIMSVQIIFYGVKYSIKLLILIFRSGLKKPKIFLPVILGLILLALLSIFVLRKTEFNRNQYYLDLIQDQMTSAAYLKSMGDSIVIFDKPVPEGWNGTKISELSVESMNILLDIIPKVENTKIYDYYISTLAWLVDIQAGTVDKDAWKKVPAEPSLFAISLNDQDLGMAIEKSLNSVMDLKEFSDYAITNNDKELMRSVAAGLQTEVHWLENLAYAEDSGFWAGNFDPSDQNLLDQAFSKIIPQAIAAQTRTFRPHCSLRGCDKLGKTAGLVRNVWLGARSFAVGEPSVMSMTGEWGMLEAGLPEIGVSHGGAGIQDIKEEPAKLPPRVEQFYAECKSKGGIVGGTGGVMSRLPVSTDGYKCWSDNGNCWDFMPYSGGRYKGGGNNCEELNLVPRPTVIDLAEIELGKLRDDISDSLSNFFLDDLKDVFTDIIVTNWDGAYSIKFSNSACSGFEQTPYFNANNYMSNYMNSYSRLDVSGNRVQGFETGGYIGSDGKTTATLNVSASGTSSSLRMDLQFVGEQAKTVNGMFYLSLSIPGSNIKCSSNISGTKSP